MNSFTFKDILPFGAMNEGALDITESFTLTLSKSDGAPDCLLISSLARHTGAEKPFVTFSLTVNGSETFYTSPDYVVGGEGAYARQQWRVPPMLDQSVQTVVTVTVPKGSVLSLRDWCSGFNRPANEWHGGLRHNAHLGFLGLAPMCTMPAFEMAAACGFPCCIVVPKVTKDGVFVCIHDDTINRTARDENGNPPSEPMRVDEMTYDELLKWDYRGSWSEAVYKGTPIPKLEDFFLLCAKTGMQPMFSTHPALTVSQWREVRDMLTRLGLMRVFNVKSFELSTLETAYSVLGDEIGSYTWDNGDARRLRVSPVGKARCRVGVEHAVKNVTRESVREILDAGFFASVWSVPRMSSEDYKRLIAWGVTEFTEDHHCSMGLNW